MNLYETIYILKPDMDEEATKAMVERFKAIVEENGEMDTLEEWGKESLLILYRIIRKAIMFT